MQATSIRSRAVRIALAVSILVLGSAPALAVQHLAFSLKNGTTFHAALQPQTIDWIEVDAKGSIRTRKINTNAIQSLTMIGLSPASQQVAHVRKLLSGLSDKDFYVRENSEKQLKDAEIGGAYQALIKKFAEEKHPLDARYRLTRILATLDNSQTEFGAQFDRLVLKDGRAFLGDAKSLALNVTYRGVELVLTRADLDRIAVHARAAERKQDQPAAIDTALFYSHKNNFYTDIKNKNHIGFDDGGAGDGLPRYTDVSTRYVAKGALFSAPLPPDSYVGIAGFDLGAYSPIPSEGNSVTVIQRIKNSRLGRRFKGVLEIRFCEPGQSGVPANVTEFSACVAKSDHSRDLILEAYNSSGQIIATVEGTHTKGVFMGLRSNEPIDQITIRSNPYLRRVNRVVDLDFAIDDVCFSNPTPTRSLTPTSQIQVRTTQHDLLLANEINWPQPNTIQISVSGFTKPITLTLEDVESVCFPRQPDAPANQPAGSWKAVLQDRSVVDVALVSGGSRWNNPVLGDISTDEIIGLTARNSVIRFPQKDDFEHGKQILVFPTCRLAVDSVQWRESSLEWNQPTLLEAQLQDNDDNEEEEEGNDSPHPDFTKVALDAPFPYDIPTVWNQLPKTRDPKTGLVKLRNGQQFVVGGQRKWTVAGFDSRGISLNFGNVTKTLEWNQIESFQLPAR